MTTSRQKLGRWGETLAAEYLVGQGYSILEYNARTPYGEIDLVARQVERRLPRDQSESFVTVFVEVKTRSSSSFGPPEQSVTPRKQAHLLASAQSYLQQHLELEGDWRIDVIAIQRHAPDQRPTILHFENAVF